MNKPILLLAVVLACASYKKTLPAVAPAKTPEVYAFSPKARQTRLAAIVFDLPMGYRYGEAAGGYNGCSNRQPMVNTKGRFHFDVSRYQDVFGKVMKEHGSPFSPELLERYNLIPQGLSAEMIADKWESPRSELDELGLRSQQLAAKATEEGRFEREVVPFAVNGDTYVADQGLRETTLEGLANLKPAFKEDGKITAGNSSQVSDGAAAVLLMSLEKAKQLGLKPRARIRAQAVVGTDPVLMLEGPIPGTAAVLKRAGLDLKSIDLFEVNEAFASVVLAWQKETGADMDKTNVNGGAIAVGHPLGASGAILMNRLLYELERRDLRYGLETMCCGGGLGTATIIDRVIE